MPETTVTPRTTIRPSEPANAWTVYRILLRWTLLQIGGTVLPGARSNP